jgi:hypothetical protein
MVAKMVARLVEKTVAMKAGKLACLKVDLRGVKKVG